MNKFNRIKSVLSAACIEIVAVALILSACGSSSSGVTDAISGETETSVVSAETTEEVTEDTTENITESTTAEPTETDTDADETVEENRNELIEFAGTLHIYSFEELAEILGIEIPEPETYYYLNEAGETVEGYSDPASGYREKIYTVIMLDEPQIMALPVLVYSPDPPELVEMEVSMIEVDLYSPGYNSQEYLQNHDGEHHIFGIDPEDTYRSYSDAIIVGGINDFPGCPESHNLYIDGTKITEQYLREESGSEGY